jgi:hypothetical protein
VPNPDTCLHSFGSQPAQPIHSQAPPDESELARVTHHILQELPMIHITVQVDRHAMPVPAANKQASASCQRVLPINYPFFGKAYLPVNPWIPSRPNPPINYPYSNGPGRNRTAKHARLTDSFRSRLRIVEALGGSRSLGRPSRTTCHRAPARPCLR